MEKPPGALFTSTSTLILSVLGGVLMNHKLCGLGPPGRETHNTGLDPAASSGCLRPYAHNDFKHLFLNKYGKYILIEDDFECDCCTPEEDERCFICAEVSEETARKLMSDCSDDPVP